MVNLNADQNHNRSGNVFGKENKPESEFSPRPRAKSTYFDFNALKTFQKYQIHCILLLQGFHFVSTIFLF